MSRTMTPAAMHRAAARLGVELASVRAVVAVESLGGGFLPDGRPKILFERHKFSQQTNSRFDAAHPALSNRKAGGYIGGAGEYARLYQAAQLDGNAAAMAASWGAFQLMGFNWRLCGERSLMGFLLAMHHNEDAHLALFTEFVASSDLHLPLQRHDWAAFARGYNGAGYARNKYDTRLAQAYATAKRNEVTP